MIKRISPFLIMLALMLSASGSIHLAPTISATPSDLTYVLDTTGNELSWTAKAGESNDDPTVYIVTVDEEILTGHNEQSWQDDVPIDVNVDGLALGTYTVEIEIRDSGFPTQALPSFDTVIVTVTDGSETTTSDEVSSTPDTTESDAADAPFPFTPMLLAIGIPVLSKIKKD